MILRLLFLLVFFEMTSISAMAAAPFARAEIVTKGKIIAGERIELAVEVFVPNFFRSAPEFPLFDLEKAIVTLPDSRAVNLSETSGDIQYSGIRRSYAIIPQAEGGYRLPDIEIPVTFADDDGKPVHGAVTVPAVAFTVAAVPGDWQGQQPFVAKGVTVAATLDRDPKTLKAGDTIVRQITITAEGTRAMMIPALDPAAAAGIRLYRQNPVLEDDVTAERQTDASRRVETLTYLVEKPGELTLPPISLKWLDPAQSAIQTVSTPQVKLTVSAAPTRQAIAPPTSEGTATKAAQEKAIGRYLVRIALLVAGTMLILAALYRVGRWAEGVLGRRRAAYRQSEAFFFRIARKALSGDDAEAGFHALEQWTRRLGFRSVDAWAQSTGDVDIQRHVAALQRALFGRPDPDAPELSFREIAPLMSRSRRQTMAFLRRSSMAQSILPPLNP